MTMQLREEPPIEKQNTPDWRPCWQVTPVDSAAQKPLVDKPRPPTAASDVDDINEYYWSQITEEDRDYLTGPRVYPSRCAWCYGRLAHSTQCWELRKSWGFEMPFGKHAGKPITEVPHDYLRWLLSRGELARDLQAAIEMELDIDR
jgi:uncharacterized protein (DUF3820 family)